MTKKPTRTYVYRGGVERRGRWISGYSGVGPSGGVLYPWMTLRECLADAKRDGFQAEFVVDRSGAVSR